MFSLCLILLSSGRLLRDRAAADAQRLRRRLPQPRVSRTKTAKRIRSRRGDTGVAGYRPAEKREKSDAYFEGGYWLILWNFLLAAAISIFLLASRISARLRDFAERTSQVQGIYK